MIAAIAPGCPSPDACMRRPRSRTRRIPSARETTPAATIAEYWPIEWPAAKAGVRAGWPAAARRSSRARRKAIEAARRAGWALTVRSRSSLGPSQARRDSGSPRASSAAANTAAAAGETSARARPMPTACEPWPGKTNASVDIGLLVGAGARASCREHAAGSGPGSVERTGPGRDARARARCTGRVRPNGACSRESRATLHHSAPRARLPAWPISLRSAPRVRAPPALARRARGRARRAPPARGPTARARTGRA